MGDGGAVFSRGTFSHAGAATSNEGGGGHSRLSRAAVAARPCHLRRRLPTVVVGAGRMEVTVMVCSPAA